MLFWVSDRTHASIGGDLHYLKIQKIDLMTSSQQMSHRSCTWNYEMRCNHYLSEGPIVDTVSGDQWTPS